MTKKKVKAIRKKITDEEYYGKRGILSEILEEDVAISIDESLRREIVNGNERRS